MSQNDDEVEITFWKSVLPTPEANQIHVAFGVVDLRVDVAGQIFLEVDLFDAIQPGSSTWTLSEGVLQLTLCKQNSGAWLHAYAVRGTSLTWCCCLQPLLGPESRTAVAKCGRFSVKRFGVGVCQPCVIKRFHDRCAREFLQCVFVPPTYNATIAGVLEPTPEKHQKQGFYMTAYKQHLERKTSFWTLLKFHVWREIADRCQNLASDAKEMPTYVFVRSDASHEWTCLLFADACNMYG